MTRGGVACREVADTDQRDVDVNEYDEEICTCEILSCDISKLGSGDEIDPDYVVVVDYDIGAQLGDCGEAIGNNVTQPLSLAGEEEFMGVISDGSLVASALASSGSDENDMRDMTPRPHGGENDVNDPDSTLSDLVDASDLETMKRAEELQGELEDALSEDRRTNDEPPSLLDEETQKFSSRTPSRQLKWVPKASIPTYMINVNDKVKIEDIGKLSITAKGKAAKVAAEKIEKMASKIKEAKQKLKEESDLSKQLAQESRERVVAAEKARVNAAKQAREAEAERVRLEAVERRKMEANLKERLKAEFEIKKDLLNKARRAVLRRGHDRVA